MIYRFGRYELNLSTRELLADGKNCHLEPQVFALLALLVDQHDRFVSKEELIEKVWDGRIVSDAALASRVKAARQALDDDGKSQRFIKTLHRRGYRFVAEVKLQSGIRSFSTADDTCVAVAANISAPPSLAVLPFRQIGDAGSHAALAIALPAELIVELSRLRWLLITARGSSFRMRLRETSIQGIGRVLGVRYCLLGSIEVKEPFLVIAVELVSTRDGGVLWAERFSGRVDDVHGIRGEIHRRVITALDLQIPLHEAAEARRHSVDNLDAWSAYHLGLQHMYRFNRRDNAAASALFEQAVAMDHCFARAHAGLSFIHFQSAFMGYSTDISQEKDSARRFADRAVELDPLDPFANFAMGRTYWLDGDLERSLGWLERSTSLSPNYAEGIYARAWTEALSLRPQEGLMHADLAMRLSPLDPLYYAMLGTRAFAHMAMKEDQEAAKWAERAACSPGAHVLISMIAAVAHALKGDRDRAAFWAANVRQRDAALSHSDFCRAFPLRSAMRERVLQALTQLGF